MGVLKVREPGGPWLPITGVGNSTGLTQDQADTRYVNISGDTMTGHLEITTPETGGAQLSVKNTNVGAEGGQIALLFGRDWGQRWNLDAYEDTFRIHDGNNVPLSCSAGVVNVSNLTASGNVTGQDMIARAWTYSNGGYMVLGGVGSNIGIYNNGDGTWVRSIGDKGIYTGGQMQMGTIQCNSSATISGDLAVNGTWTTINHATIRNACHVTSNGTTGSWYYDQGFLVQCASGVSRSGYGMHPGGVAGSMDMNTNNASIFFHNTDGGWYTDIWCSTVSQASSVRGKTDITSWPPKSAGSAVMDACNRLSLIDVVSYRIKPELALVQATAEGEERRLHDCDTDDCDGTIDEPCTRVREQQNPHIGILIEDLATVLPEAVALDAEGKPGGMRTGTMIGYLLAVCKEQQGRIEALEHQLEAA